MLINMANHTVLMLTAAFAVQIAALAHAIGA
jgi:hypothetical protein